MNNTQDSAALLALSPYSPNVTNQIVTHALDNNLYIISVLRSTPPQRRTCVCDSAYIHIYAHTHTHVCVRVTPHVRVTVQSR